MRSTNDSKKALQTHLKRNGVDAHTSLMSLNDIMSGLSAALDHDGIIYRLHLCLIFLYFLKSMEYVLEAKMYELLYWTKVLFKDL